MWNSASLVLSLGHVSLIKRQSEKANRYIICGEENGLLTSPYCQFWQFCCWHDVLVLFQNHAWQAQTDTAVSLWVRALGPGISLIFGARAGHFAATPQSDVVRICAKDFGVMAMLSVQQKMLLLFFRAFFRALSDHNFTYIIVQSKL